MNRERRLQQLYVNLYQELYIGMVEHHGVDLDEAQEQACQKVEHVQEIVEGVLEELDADGWYCNLRWVIPLDYIENWDKLAYQEKEQGLYHLGIDTQLPWREREGDYIFGNNRLTGRYVEGSERCDKIWCSSRHASLEAIMEYETHARGKEHGRDLRRMSRQ